MNTAEIVAALRAKSPTVVEGLTDTAVKKLVAATLEVVREGIAQAEPGRMTVSGLGRFNVKAGTKEVEGETQAKRKVAFLAAKGAEAKPNKATPEARAAKKAARKSSKQAERQLAKAEKKTEKKTEKKAG